jgi:hypothetical protein
MEKCAVATVIAKSMEPASVTPIPQLDTFPLQRAGFVIPCTSPRTAPSDALRRWGCRAADREFATTASASVTPISVDLPAQPVDLPAKVVTKHRKGFLSMDPTVILFAHVSMAHATRGRQELVLVPVTLGGGALIAVSLVLVAPILPAPVMVIAWTTDRVSVNPSMPVLDVKYLAQEIL